VRTTVDLPPVTQQDGPVLLGQFHSSRSSAPPMRLLSGCLQTLGIRSCRREEHLVGSRRVHTELLEGYGKVVLPPSLLERVAVRTAAGWAATRSSLAARSMCPARSPASTALWRVIRTSLADIPHFIM
jgi:hypothetical protein